MAENKYGLHFAWFTGGTNGGCFYTSSPDNGENFQLRERISAVGSHPQIISDADGELIIAWDEYQKGSNTTFKRIGIENRTVEGISKDKLYITSDSSNASYQVLSLFNEASLMIAYTKKQHEKYYVAFQHMDLD